jgi:hypothetical protein
MQAILHALENGPCEKMMKNAVKMREDSFIGQPTTVLRREEFKGTRVTYWMSPAFGCAILKYTVERFGDTDGWTATFEGRAVSAKVGEPDPRLFEDNAYRVTTEEDVEKILEAEAARDNVH